MSRIGKRIVLCLSDDLFIVMHLMIAGRLRWRPPGEAVPKKLGLCAFDFPNGTLLFTEAGTTKRASLYVVRGMEGLVDFDRGGIEPLDASLSEFKTALRRENRTLKRALTDPRLVSGIGNAYSDEILFSAGLSPVKLTSSLSDAELKRLHGATRSTLIEWTDRLRAEAEDGFPEKVTAFREEWRCMVATANRARGAARGCAGSVMRRTSATTAPRVRPEESSWPIGGCPGS